MRRWIMQRAPSIRELVKLPLLSLVLLLHPLPLAGSLSLSLFPLPLESALNDIAIFFSRMKLTGNLLLSLTVHIVELYHSLKKKE
jgi:hypothetical protein